MPVQTNQLLEPPLDVEYERNIGNLFSDDAAVRLHAIEWLKKNATLEVMDIIGKRVSEKKANGGIPVQTGADIHELLMSFIAANPGKLSNSSVAATRQTIFTAVVLTIRDMQKSRRLRC